MLTNCLAACAHLSITVSEIQRDICEKIDILSYPLAFNAPVRGFQWEYRHPLWFGKTRMVWLSDGEKISKFCTMVELCPERVLFPFYGYIFRVSKYGSKKGFE